MSENLVYVGKIIELKDIHGADFIVSATVICGQGGKWHGVVKRTDFNIGDLCIVFLPDSLIPESDDFRFMEKHKWRVKMCKFKGAPSEVLIMPMQFVLNHNVGEDVTKQFEVTKYIKLIPHNLQGIAKGPFPGFIPKTDEPNYQSNPDLVQALIGKPYYITEKVDGTSSTAYKYKKNFGVCSRNLDLEEGDNVYWNMANKYELRDKLPEGVALQWETAGPGINKNTKGLKDISVFAFSAYNIIERRYFSASEFIHLCDELDFPTALCLECGNSFNIPDVSLLGEGKYANGNEREGIVIRSRENIDNRPISFKVINLNYDN